MSIFDFTGVNDQGFTQIPVGRYEARTVEWWLRKKEDTGVLVIDIDMEIISGTYKGETSRYFHSITDQEFSKGYLLRMLKGVGIISDDDRGANGELKAEFVYGETDENGRVRIVSMKVNDEEREVDDLVCTAVVESYNNNRGERVTGIKKLEEPKDGDSAPATNIAKRAGKATKPASKGKAKPKKDGLPF